MKSVEIKMKNLFYLFVLCLSFSCAKPNYVDDQTQKIERVTQNCKLIFKKENLCIEMDWESFPTESEFGSFLLRFTDVNDRDLLISPDHELGIILWMPSMGHGSSPVTLREIEEGIYRASDVFFIMSGAWDIRFQLKDGERIVEEAIQKITL